MFSLSVSPASPHSAMATSAEGHLQTEPGALARFDYELVHAPALVGPLRATLGGHQHDRYADAVEPGQTGFKLGEERA